MKIEKLKPCPFCGGKAILYKQRASTLFSETHTIGCSKCGISTFEKRTKKQVITLWNRRIK